MYRSIALAALALSWSLAAGCTGVSYNNESATITVGEIGDGSFEGPNEAWQIEGGKTHKITATDQGGGLCAILATSAEAHNARSAAIERAIEDGKDTYTYEYRIHSADEFSDGKCEVWARFGGASGNLRYNPEESTGEMQSTVPGSADMKEFGLDIVPPGLEVLSGLYLRGYFRFAGGSMTVDPDDPSTGIPNVDSFVQDMSLGGFIDIVPWWLYGVGLHIYLHYAYITGEWSTGSMLDLTIKVFDFAAKVGIGIDDRQIGYDETLPIHTNGTTYLFSVDFTGPDK
jgi:hypothetical protein